ncbi:Tyrosine protein kinase [Entamoeba marina]
MVLTYIKHLKFGSGAELSCASDVYSFGLIILEFLTGNNGFYGDCNTNDDQSIFLAITNSQRPKIPSDFSPSLSSVLQKCLSPSPHGRPSMEVVLGSFDSVVVDSTMTSPSAIAFWTSQCVDIDLPMFEVSYDDLLYFITEVAMLEVNEEEVEVVKDALKVYFPENGIVSAVDFDNVALWFGDFFNSYKILEEMTEIKEADWFTGLIDKKIAEGRLSGKPDGVFLIRMSFTNAQKTPFTLTRNVNGMVKHSRIERVSYDFVNIRYKINIDGKKISGPDLPSIINALIENNIVTTADDGETVSAYGDL